ncbi:MAG: glycosyltransferase [Cyanobacteria bacterium P01_C01_bin.72]
MTAINYRQTAPIAVPAIFSPNKILLFDLGLGGHHGNYIRYLIEFWLAEGIPSSLDIVVLPQFLQLHQDVVAAIPSQERERLRIIPIKAAEAAQLKPRDTFKHRTWRNFQEWDLMCHYAQLQQATECLMMYFDTCELPLTLGRPAPCPVSGIYFKPTFHYGNFPGDQPSRSETIQRWREKLTLPRILRHPQLKTLFCLDPSAIAPLQEFNPTAEIVYLPDPVEANPKQDKDSQLRQSLNIAPDKIIMLLFGAIDGRKGIFQLIEALEQLPREINQRLCLLLVGAINEADRRAITPRIEALRKSSVQIITKYQFVTESAVPEYFQLADLVLAPYQKHIGMSGILLLAAAADKPVLSSQYGLMGRLTKQYGLGIEVDATAPLEIALGITQFVLNYPQSPGDAVKRRQFAHEHSVQDYAATIAQRLYIKH